MSKKTRNFSTNGWEAKKPTHEELSEALFVLWDAFDRAQITMYMLGDIAECIHDGRPFDSTKIRIGVRMSELNPFAKSLLESLLPIKVLGQKCVFKVNDVMVELKFIKHHYKVLDTPEQHMYLNEIFFLPNPFGYYKSQYKSL